MLQTSNYNLNKPEGSDIVDISVLNENFDTIDTTIKILDNRTAPYVVTSGSANIYIATINGIVNYTAGMRICVQINTTSTGNSTLNINGLGAKPILDSLGNQISNGGLKANIPYQLCYNGTNFIVLGKGGGGTATSDKLLNGYTATVDSGQITGTMAERGNATINLNAGESYSIQEGHYSGGIITANNLLSQTNATATADQILSGYTAWVDGNKVNGTATIESLGGKKYITEIKQQEQVTINSDTCACFWLTGLDFKPLNGYIYETGQGDIYRIAIISNGTIYSKCDSNYIHNLTNNSTFSKYVIYSDNELRIPMTAIGGTGSSGTYQYFLTE